MDYIRLLFWLKWKLMWRGYARSTVTLVGVIVTLLFFLPFAIGIAIGTVYGYRLLLPPDNTQLLRAVLLGIYLLWILGPLLGYTLNESYDITRLFLYPLSPRQLFTGAIFGSLLDFPVLIALPVLLAIFFGFINAVPAALLVILPVVLFLFHTIAINQTLLLVGAGFLRSRRYRDIMIVVGPLLAMLFYLSFQLLPRAMVFNYRGIVNSRGWDLINYLPPGLAARTIAAASAGQYGLSVIFLLLLAAVSVATVYLAGWLIDKVATGVVISAPVAVQVGHREQSPSRTGSPLELRLPPVIAAIAMKEVKYFTRDPFFKSLLVSALFMLGFWFVIILHPFSPDRGGFNFAALFVWIIPVLAMQTAMRLTGNLFGTEGSAAATLFTFPSSRRQILLGKNVIQFPVLIVYYSLVVTVICLLGKLTGMLLPLLLWVMLMTGMQMAVGNLTSIYFPMPAVVRGWRMRQNSAGQGCGYGFVYLGAQALTVLLLLPPLAALLAPTYWVAPIWFSVTIPFAFAYVLGAYFLSLHLAEPLLLKREIDIAEKLRPPE